MKFPHPATFSVIGACLFASACGKPPAKPLADGAALRPSSPLGPGHERPASASAANSAQPSTPPQPIQWMPTQEQKRKMSVILDQMNARFKAMQQASAQAKAKEGEERQAKAARGDLAKAACEAILRDPNSGEEARVDATRKILELRADSAEPSSVPNLEDVQANQSFDDLSYQFRQAMAGHNHAKALAVVQKMGELGGAVSPSLAAKFTLEANRCFGGH